MSVESEKRAAAAAALAYVQPKLNLDTVVGIGTGSTTNYFIDLLAEIRDHFSSAVSSSNASTKRLTSCGIKVVSASLTERISVYIDGADEIDRSKALIKGGGGALTREKIIAAESEEFICIVDSMKLVDQLGTFPLPVEVIPIAQRLVSERIRELRGKPQVRKDFHTDNGNIILDVEELAIDNPDALEQVLNNITGVVCNGIFALNRPDVVFVGKNTL